MERCGCALRFVGLRRLALAALVALLMPIAAHAAEPALSGPLLSPDGTQISASGLVSKVTADYIVLRESGSRSYLIIPWTANEPLHVGQPLDATGVLATQPNGYRYLQNPQIAAWLDAAGSIIVVPVPAPGPEAGREEFAGREALSEAASKAGRSGTMSMTEEEGQGPPGGDPDDPIFCDTLQIAVDQDPDAMVELHSRPILSVGSSSFVLGENADTTVSPTQSLTTSYSGTVTTSERVLSVAGVLNKNNPISLVVGASGGFAHVFTAAPGSIAYAKSLPDDAAVTLGTTSTGKIVTAVLGPDVFYVEEDDRACGVRVEKTSHGRTAGQRAYVAGAMKTNASHERYVQATQTNQAGEGECAPLRMINASLGGQGYYANVGPPAVGQEGVTGGAGLNTVGLLVRTMGKITVIDTATPPTWFKLADGSVESGVKVDLVPVTGTTIPLVGVVDQFVTVTAVCSLEASGSTVTPVLRPVAFGPITFSPAAGDYCECQAVQIIGPDPRPDMDVTVWYTIDGSDPTPENPNARLYDPAGVVMISIAEDSSTTVKAAAFAGGWAGSGTYSSAYSCPQGGIGGGGTGYTCWRYTDVEPGISGLVVSDVYQPATICLSWASAANKFIVRRQSWTEPLLSWEEEVEGNLWSTGHSACDSSGFTLGAKLAYAVRAEGSEDEPPSGLIECWHEPDDPDCHPQLVKQWGDSGWKFISVTPARVPATEACAVDSRVDTREADPLPLNHNFAGSTYRGGLFAGRPGGTDGSGAARSFLKFDLSDEEIGANEGIWAASINAVYTGSLSPTVATTVGCQVLGNDSWSASSLNWSNSPAFAPAAARDRAVVGGGALSAGSWCHWSSSGSSVLSEMFGDGILSAGLAATQEADSGCGWAYFAKQEYDATRPPQILYAFGSEFVSGGGGPSAPCVPIGLTMDADTVLGGLSLGGTVFLNRAAPTGGRLVHLSAGPACSATVEDVVVAAGQTSARFVVSTAIVEEDEENGVVSAAGGPPGCTASFTIDNGEEEE